LKEYAVADLTNSLESLKCDNFLTRNEIGSPAAAQGTAATAVAGLYGALAVQGKPFKELAKHRIVVLGAGSAGMGVARMLALGMVKQVPPSPEPSCRMPMPASHFLNRKFCGKPSTGQRPEMPSHTSAGRAARECPVGEWKCFSELEALPFFGASALDMRAGRWQASTHHASQTHPCSKVYSSPEPTTGRGSSRKC
jgi:hypothetical protein